MTSTGAIGRGASIRTRLSGMFLASTAMTCFAAPSLAQDAPANESHDIIVTGIRSSLQSALQEKRRADNLIEVIKAEDIGKLPDQNLAEVLENVTGIQITRDAGVGTGVQIRGTDANQVQINGVSTVGSGSGRSGISFDDLPASLIASVEVIKDPTAQTVEGSVGGTINLRTIRPLDLRKPLIEFRAQMERSDLAQSTLPRLSGTVGDKWDTGLGEFGIVLSGSYARQDVSNFEPRVDRDNLNLPGSANDSQSFPFLQIQFLQQGVENYHYETYNGTASLAWKPAHNLKFYFDGTLNNQQRAQQSYRLQLSGMSSQGVIDGTNNTAFETVDLGTLDTPDGPVDLGTVQSAVVGTTPIGVVKGTIDPNLRSSSDTGARVTHSRVFDFGTEWEGGKLTIGAEASLATSKSHYPNLSTTLNFINPHGPQPVFGTGSIDNGVPMAFDLRNGLTFGIDQASPYAPTSAELLDPANYQLYQVTQGANSADNKEKAARIDFTYDTSDLNPIVHSINFGYRWNQNTAINNVFSNNITLSGNGKGAGNVFNAPKGDLFADILTAGPKNFNSADGRTLYFRDFLLISGARAFSDPDGVRDSLNAAITASNAANPQYPAVPLLTVPNESASGYFRIKETTNAAYFQMNMEGDVFGMHARGNVGLRWLRTRLTSTGNNVANGNAGGQIVKKSGYNFLLPRVNMVLEPADKFLVRGGISRDIRRPDFDALSTSYSFTTSATAPVSGGNPNLVPESVWSFDLSGEYYFAPSSLISLGFFHKIRTNLFADVQENPTPIGYVGANPQFSTDPTCPGGGIYNPIADRNLYASPPGNGICAPLASTFNVPGNKTQTGIEVAVQHDLSAWEDVLGFASGFGVIANFTYQKAGGSGKAYRDALVTRNLAAGLGFTAANGYNVPLQSKITLTNLSKYSYNATLFYDKYGLNARLRYTWRSSYIMDASAQAFRWDLPVVAGARGQLNASINYDINDHINIGLEGINLLRADQKLYCVNNDALLCFQGLTDRRITAGVSVKF